MNNSSIITLPSKTFSNILELIKMMTGLKVFFYTYILKIINNNMCQFYYRILMKFT